MNENEAHESYESVRINRILLIFSLPHMGYYHKWVHVVHYVN